MIAQDALRHAISQLRDAKVPDPARDARILMAFAMGIAPDRLTLHLSDDLADEACQTFQQAVAKRMMRQPVSQIVGQRQFFGRHFMVTSDVLDPRPETETLVLAALDVTPVRILDLGTGSGCVLLTLLAECPKATGLGVDISPKALRIAAENAQGLGVHDRAEFKQSNWFDNVTGQFDLIVSNPPYIDQSEWENLDPEPKNWEPKIALTPGADGLAPYRVLADQARHHVSPGGWLMVEIGWKQGLSVAAILEQTGWSDVMVLKDLNEHDRVVVGQAPLKISSEYRCTKA